jgi:hypothetical protein
MMENEESTDRQNTTDNTNGNREDIPQESENSWKNDVFDETDPNLPNDRKDPKRTLFY